MTFWTTLFDGESESVWVSPLDNNGDFDYRLVRQFRDLRGATDIEKGQNPYHIEIGAVAPSELTPEHIRAIYRGTPEENQSAVFGEQLNDYYLAMQYGSYAPLWNMTGRNKKTLLRLSNEESRCIMVLFGFYMDKPRNGIGSNGWDLIKGNIDRPLRELREARNANL